MEIRPIKTEQDYNTSIRRIEVLWGAKKDTPQGDELDLLVTLVESYEMKHYPIAPPAGGFAIPLLATSVGWLLTKFAHRANSLRSALNKKQTPC